MKTKIASELTHRQILDAMGSAATDAEASAMRELLRSDERATEEIPDDEWRALMDQAIKIAGDGAVEEPDDELS